MRAVQLQAIGQVGLTTLPDPVPGAGEILIRVEAAGICGTDRHLFHGEFPCNPPVTLGHEFSGLVVAGDMAVGTRVACDPNIWCGTCPQCRRGRVNLCEGNVAIGLHRDGGFAEYAVMPVHRAHVLPVGLPPLWLRTSVWRRSARTLAVQSASLRRSAVVSASNRLTGWSPALAWWPSPRLWTRSGHSPRTFAIRPPC